MPKKTTPKTTKSIRSAAGRTTTVNRHPAKTSGNSRVRFGKLPKPPDRMEIPYAQSREGLKNLTPGEMTRLVLSTDAFKVEIGSLLDKLDAQRGRKGNRRGLDPLYTSWELELVFIYQRVCGLRSVKEARDRLAGDRGAHDRRVLGFDRSRETNPARPRKLLNGVPSESTLSRHRRRVGEKRRRDAYERCFKRIVTDHLDEFAEFREEARLLALDGTTVETHYTVPRFHGTTGELLNAGEVTCPDGGYGAKTAGGGKAGEGFNEVILTSLSGLPVGAETIPIQKPENQSGARVIEEFGRDIAPHLDGDKVNVLIADGGFLGDDVRRAARDAGLLEQVHFASHGDKVESKAHVRTLNGKKWLIDGYPNWFANGHREIFCRCGNGRISKEILARRGKPVARVVGDCENCGHISVTSGQWRVALNMGRKGQSGWMRVLPGEEEAADLAFGNPLTFNHPLAQVYGNKRFAHNEGLNSTLSDRFRFNRHKRWFRRRDQVDTDAFMIFTIMHALAIEQRRSVRAAGKSSTPISGSDSGPGAVASGPPGLARAA